MSSNPPRHSRITGTGSYLPPNRLSNDALAARLARDGVETSDTWIVERTGIRARHFAAPDVSSSDLAAHAARHALEAAGRSAADIDLIIVATSTPDMVFPSTACILQAKLGISVRLTQFCWADLDPASRKQAAQIFGIDLDSVTTNFNFCVYLDITNRMKGEAGKTYNLRIKTKDGKTITAKTTIPRTVKIDSAEFIKPPGINQNDTMAQMRATINEPKGEDFYRYFTAINGSSYVAGSPCPLASGRGG